MLSFFCCNIKRPEITLRKKTATTPIACKKKKVRNGNTSYSERKRDLLHISRKHILLYYLYLYNEMNLILILKKTEAYLWKLKAMNYSERCLIEGILSYLIAEGHNFIWSTN